MNFNTDLNYGRIMDLDMALSSSPSLAMDSGGGKGQIGMVPAVPGHQQTLAAVGPWTQMWSKVSDQTSGQPHSL